MMLKLTIAAILAIIPMLPAAQPSPTPVEATPEAIDSINSLLAAAKTPADSLPLLYDLYDLGTRDDKARLNRIVYPTARRLGDLSAQADLLRQLASFYSGHDSIQALIENEAAMLPQSDDRDETMLFIGVMRTISAARTMSEDDRREYLHDTLTDYISRDSMSDLEAVDLLFRICVLLGRDTNGELMNDFLDRLHDHLDRLPESMTAIRNLYYTRCAQTFTDGRLYDRAVEADKHLLMVIDDLVKKYAAQGREFRNYRTNRYICYRRLLCNYPALSEREVEQYYRQIQALAAKDPDVAKDLAENPLAEIYYLMATRRYAEALQLLKPFLAGETKVRYNPVTIYRMAEEAARNTGDRQTMYEAMRLYSNQIDSMLSTIANDNFRDLKLVYDVTRLREQKATMDLEARQAGEKSRRMVLIIILCASLVLLALSLFIFIQYRRMRALSNNLASSNDDLRKERDELRNIRNDLVAARDNAKKASRIKTDFINNISHEIREPLNAIAGFSQLIVDNVDGEKRKYLDRYATLVEVNIDLVQSLVNDVLSLSEIDNGKVRLSIRPFSVHQACHQAVESVALRVQPGVTMRFDDSTPDVLMETDRRRVEQVLINLLQNAAKFTAKGSITLSYTTDDESVLFCVTDTGIGIPAGKHELIFERYEKLDSGTQGTGLGLNICRIVSRLLKGDVWSDKTYRSGARFYFRVPLK